MGFVFHVNILAAQYFRFDVPADDMCVMIERICQKSVSLGRVNTDTTQTYFINGKREGRKL